MRDTFSQIPALGIILLSLLIPLTTSGQGLEEARRELEKRKIAWSDDEFIMHAQRGDTEVVQLFLTAGMNPDAKDSEGRTALIWASANGHTRAVKALLDLGANANAIDNKGMTSLMEASSRGRAEIIRLLLEKGANVNASARDGRTALMFASAEGHTVVANLLIDKGAFIDATNRDGGTSLIMAASNGRTEVVRVLLERGADAEVRDNMGLTALMWAVSNRHTAVVRLLRKAAKEEIYSAPSQTLTNPQLQHDVWNYIVMLELASDEKCQEHSIVSTKVIEYPSRVGINKWAERWHVDRCGQRIIYRVDFRPDGVGGAYFTVSEEE
jgi:ankyrin repeat protein